MAQTPLEYLEELQQGLRLLMPAVEKRDFDEAKRLLLMMGSVMDRALEAERRDR